MFDHEGHELSGVSSDAEELQTILLNEVLKSRMGGDANTMTVRLFQDLAEGNKGLDIAAGANDLDNNIELWWRVLTRSPTKAWRNVPRG
jgi:hypothetical protein